MAIFRVRHADATGRSATTFRSAPSAETLLRDLSAEGLSALSVNGVSESGTRTCGVVTARRRCALHTVQEFTDGIGTLLNAGLTVPDALAMAAMVFPSAPGRRGGARRLIRDISIQVQSGRSFADSLEHLPVEFPSMYRGLVRIGEQLGTLTDVLGRLSTYLAGLASMRSRISGALAYPLLVLSTAFIGIAALAWIAVPHMRELLLASGSVLPAEVDRIIAGAKSFVRLQLGIPFCLAAAAATMKMIAGRNQGFAMKLHTCLLKLPLAGRVQLARELANVAYALDLLTESGAPLPWSIRQAATVAENLRVKAALHSVADQIARGVSPSVAFAAHRLSGHSRRSLFPELFCRWIAIGESIGHSQTAFGQLYILYRAELDRYVARLSTLAEPTLIILVGIALIAVIVGFITPLFSLFGSLIV